MPNLQKVRIYADESCLGNQFKDQNRRGGAAGLAEVWTGERWERRDYWVAEKATTNNRMAIRSAIEGLGLLRRKCQVHFVSDSQYLIKGMTEWIDGWVKRGWKRKAGAVENKELWKVLLKVAARHEVGWEWVRGHDGHPQNEYVDHLAVQAANEQSQSGGFVPSGFEEWLEEEREKRNRFWELNEHAPPR